MKSLNKNTGHLRGYIVLNSYFEHFIVNGQKVYNQLSQHGFFPIVIVVMCHLVPTSESFEVHKSTASKGQLRIRVGLHKTFSTWMKLICTHAKNITVHLQDMLPKAQVESESWSELPVHFPPWGIVWALSL
jgi:hypothetical protein